MYLFNVYASQICNAFQVEDVRLIGSLVPRDSRFLPFVPKRKSVHFYPYACFRLVCERLYGSVPCYAQYSKDIPASEFSGQDKDMVVTEV